MLLFFVCLFVLMAIGFSYLYYYLLNKKAKDFENSYKNYNPYMTVQNSQWHASLSPAPTKPVNVNNVTKAEQDLLNSAVLGMKLGSKQKSTRDSKTVNVKGVRSFNSTPVDNNSSVFSDVLIVSSFSDDTTSKTISEANAFHGGGGNFGGAGVTETYSAPETVSAPSVSHHSCSTANSCSTPSSCSSPSSCGSSSSD